MAKKVQKAATSSHKKANIAVAIVVGIAALILVAIAVLSAVHVDPLDKVKKPNSDSAEYYELYDLNTTAPLMTNGGVQSKIRTALGDMDFSVMSAMLQWKWDYSYNFSRNSEDEKVTLTASEVRAKAPAASEYMVEIVYAPGVEGGEITSAAQSLKVDGETVYFDRLKIVIGNTNGTVGEIYLYPYLYEYATNEVADDGLTYQAYRVTPVKVRANTTKTYNALAEIVTAVKNG